MLQLRNDIVPVGGATDGRIGIAIARMRGGLSPRTVSKSVATFEPFTAPERARTRSRRADELKIVTGFLQRPVHFQLRYAAVTFERVSTNTMLSQKRVIVTVLLGVSGTSRVPWSPPPVKL